MIENIVETRKWPTRNFLPFGRKASANGISGILVSMEGNISKRKLPT